jgi:hypothetical protein
VNFQDLPTLLKRKGRLMRWFGPMSCLALSLALCLVGCAEPRLRTGQQYRAELARLSYPGDAKTGRDLPIEAVREDNHLRLANTTPRVYNDVQLWLNEQYVQEIDRIAIGAENRYRLSRFVNRHGERFPLPGLLAPRKTQPVVRAELYNPQTQRLHRLTVQPDATEDE